MSDPLFESLIAGCTFDLEKYQNDAINVGLIKRENLVKIERKKKNKTNTTNVKEKRKLGQLPEKNQNSSKNLINLSKAEINKNLKIYTIGNDVPRPIVDLDFENFIKFKLPKNFYSQPTPVQAQSIPVLRDRRNCLVCAPTGSGKTISFLLPIIERLALSVDNDKTDTPSSVENFLIIQPSKELATQTYDELLKIMPEDSSVRPHNLSDISEKTRKIFSSEKSGQIPNVLLTTPNKLIYLLKSSNQEISKIFQNFLSKTKTLIIDEADKLFEESHEKNKERSFRTQLGEIFQILTKFKCHFFSATYSSDVEHWCNTYLDEVVNITIGTRNTANDKIDQKLIFTNDEDAKIYNLKRIFMNSGSGSTEAEDENLFKPPVLIFVQSKERVKDLYKELKNEGIIEKFKISSIHGDLNDAVRNETIKKFRTGEYWVLICTELMGRGMDFENVGLVINFDLPTSPISYIHRIGRTARGHNKTGKAVTFFTVQDKHILRTIGGIMKQAGCKVPDYIMEMKKLNNKERKKISKSNPERQAIGMQNRWRKEVQLKKEEKKTKDAKGAKKDKKSVKRSNVSSQQKKVSSSKRRKTVDDIL